MHYHVERHPNDDDVFLADDIFTALDYAQDELSTMASFHYEGISANGEAGDYREAYKAFLASEELANLAANAANMADTFAQRKPAPPLYRLANDKPYTVDVPVLRESAERTVDLINTNVYSRMSIRECSLDVMICEGHESYPHEPGRLDSCPECRYGDCQCDPVTDAPCVSLYCTQKERSHED